jgi:hypothetical protein
MNSPTAPLKPRHRVWPWILGLCLAPFLVIGGMIWSAVHLSRDAAALRNEIVAASDARWQAKVQFTAGPMVLGAVRTGLTLIKDLPDEAREALAALHSASIGVYERTDSGNAGQRRRFVAAADQVMARRGWTRIVGVEESGDTVLIYLPEAAANAEPNRVCLAVCSGRELVIVAAGIDADALAALATREIGRHQFARL